MPRKHILTLSQGGDRRSIGGADQAVALVLKDPSLFPDLLAGLWSAQHEDECDGVLAKTTNQSNGCHHFMLQDCEQA